MAKFPTYEKMAKNVAEIALDEILYDGKSIREWIQIIASEDCINRAEAIKALGEDMRKCQKLITDEEVLIGFNMAVALCNKHLAESEVQT